MAAAAEPVMQGEAQPSNRKCGNCSTCTDVIEGSTCTSSKTGGVHNIKVQNDVDCNSKSVICLITCDKCSQQTIRSSGGKMKHLHSSLFRNPGPLRQHVCVGNDGGPALWESGAMKIQVGNFLRLILQPAVIGWPTGNRKKLSSCQAQLGQATCLAVA